jgi:hypothetical protein
LLSFHFALISETLGHPCGAYGGGYLLTGFSTGVEKAICCLKTSGYKIKVQCLLSLFASAVDLWKQLRKASPKRKLN